MVIVVQLNNSDRDFRLA